MKTRMQRWLAGVALSLVAIAAWGTGAAAQSLSGVYGGEQCPYRLTFRGKDVVYIQFLAGGKVMQELPGQYKVDGDKVAVTAPSWGAVFTHRCRNSGPEDQPSVVGNSQQDSQRAESPNGSKRWVSARGIVPSLRRFCGRRRDCRYHQ